MVAAEEKWVPAAGIGNIPGGADLARRQHTQLTGTDRPDPRGLKRHARRIGDRIVVRARIVGGIDLGHIPSRVIQRFGQRSPGRWIGFLHGVQHRRHVRAEGPDGRGTERDGLTSSDPDQHAGSVHRRPVARTRFELEKPESSLGPDLLNDAGRLRIPNDAEPILAFRKAVPIRTCCRRTARSGVVIVDAEAPAHAARSTAILNIDRVGVTRSRRGGNSILVAVPRSARDRHDGVPAGGAIEPLLRLDGNLRRTAARRAGAVRRASDDAIAARHGFLERIDAQKGRPVEQIPVPLRVGRAGGAHRCLGGCILKPAVGCVIDVAGEGVEKSAIRRGRDEVLIDRRGAAAGQHAAPSGIAGPVRHTAGVVQQEDDVRSNLLGNEGRNGVVLIHRLGFERLSPQETDEQGQRRGSTTRDVPAVHGHPPVLFCRLFRVAPRLLGQIDHDPVDFVDVVLLQPKPHLRVPHDGRQIDSVALGVEHLDLLIEFVVSSVDDNRAFTNAGHHALLRQSTNHRRPGLCVRHRRSEQAEPRAQADRCETNRDAQPRNQSHLRQEAAFLPHILFFHVWSPSPAHNATRPA
ncbi:protein of unknown function [Candidatus Nitrospira inopinata]|uniref:Uncharacterized protein n=1 Tax=Candidatus Nitrospira inopinata TaxID=1715989 RepID=A0A0S4KWX4_9BACT|nr:protein of unknown function [Candidatus Nitrospira inopinata]